MKPLDYRQRRTWQLEARARGEVPECGREVCHRPADPAWVGSGTGVELLYCAGCAGLINSHTPGTCRPERADIAHVDYTISIDHGNTRDEGIVSTWQDGELISVRPFNEPDLTTANGAQTPKRPRAGGLLLASMMALSAGADPFPGMPAPRAAEPNPDRGRHAKKTERRRERKAAEARRG